MLGAVAGALCRPGVGVLRGLGVGVLRGLGVGVLCRAGVGVSCCQVGGALLDVVGAHVPSVQVAVIDSGDRVSGSLLTHPPRGWITGLLDARNEHPAEPAAVGNTLSG